MRTLLVGLLVVAASSGVAIAAPTKKEKAEAKKHYDAAEAEVKAGKFADAAKDYTEAYELTKDAALLFKVASAYQNAGACDSAVPYYRQYLKEAKPEPKFVELATNRLKACNATVEDTPPVVAPPPPEEVKPPEVKATPEVKPTEPEVPPATPVVTPTAPVAPPEPVKPADKPAHGDDDVEPGHERDKAWAVAGGALVLGGAGVVLYAQGKRGGLDASSAGDGYKTASYVLFGLGGAAAIASAYLFVRHDPHHKEATSLIVPTAQPHGGGVAALFRF